MDVPNKGGSADSIGDHAKVGIVTVSDRASAGKYDDKSGPAILQVCTLSEGPAHDRRIEAASCVRLAITK